MFYTSSVPPKSPFPKNRTPPKCFCGKAGIGQYGPPDIPRQKGNPTELYWLCADHAAACKFLVPRAEIPSQQDLDRDCAGLVHGCVVDCVYRHRGYSERN